MATINSLLFLFSTLAPNVEPPGNYPVTQAPPEWVQSSASKYGQNAPVVTQLNCGLVEALRCYSHCQKNCSNYDRPIPCQDICVLGCVCIDPFIRGPDGSCIMPRECPENPIISDTTEEPVNIQCHADEEVSHFPHCQRNCSNIFEMIVCLDSGAPGCVCKPPKIRGPDDSCIMPYQCPIHLRSLQDSIDESFSNMKCMHDEEATCLSQCQPKLKDFPCPMYCMDGCVCTPPNVRGPNGCCITPFQCSALKKTSPKALGLELRTNWNLPDLPKITCKENEEFSMCVPICPDNYQEAGPCKSICVPGCKCKQGFLKNKEGTCIKIEDYEEKLRTNWNPDWNLPDLPKITCKENEEFSICVPICPDNCYNYQEIRPCKRICLPGCKCKQGFLKNKEGTCIKIEDCEEKKPHECTVDEIYKDCESYCETDCYNHNVTDRKCEDSRCKAGCFCKSGLVRSANGDCIPPDSCPVQSVPNWNMGIYKNSVSHELRDTMCPPKEKFSCFSHCELDCTTYDTWYWHLVCPMVCVEGCVCIPPLIRGPDGACIMRDQCPAIEKSAPKDSVSDDDDDDEPSHMKCPPNEEVSCFSHCQPNCTTYNTYFNCPMFCVQGCVCIPPRIRGPDGACIMPDQCPAMEKSAPKGSQCRNPQECGNYNKEDEDIYDDDTTYDDTHEKALSGFLASDEICSENEVYKKCGTACQKNCDNYDKDIPCTMQCVSGCFCKEPMIRGPHGKCIQKEECPEKLLPSDACPMDEEFKVCGTACQKNCQNYDKHFPCEFKCEPGCFCKEPMIRGPSGRCVYKEECPEKPNESTFSGVVCSENEEYRVCGTACQKNCQNYDKNIPCGFKCEPGCFCKEPMIRGPEGKCIHKEDCPEKSNESEQKKKTRNVRILPDYPKFTCLLNEEFSYCSNLCPDNCDNYGEFRPCKLFCMPGCECIDGYVKNKHGVCIKKEDCEKKIPVKCNELEDYNECGSYCETNCYNYNDTERKCDIRCKTGCFCKSGLVRSPDGKCIPQDECPVHVPSKSNFVNRFLKRKQHP